MPEGNCVLWREWKITKIVVYCGSYLTPMGILFVWSLELAWIATLAWVVVIAIIVVVFSVVDWCVLPIVNGNSKNLSNFLLRDEKVAPYTHTHFDLTKRLKTYQKATKCGARFVICAHLFARSLIRRFFFLFRFLSRTLEN